MKLSLISISLLIAIIALSGCNTSNTNVTIGDTLYSAGQEFKIFNDACIGEGISAQCQDGFEFCEAKDLFYYGGPDQDISLTSSACTCKFTCSEEKDESKYENYKPKITPTSEQDCLEINELYSRNDCYYELAAGNNDEEICDKIVAIQIKGETEYCNQIMDCKLNALEVQPTNEQEYLSSERTKCIERYQTTYG